MPNNIPPSYQDIVEKYEYESTTILTRGGFYKLVHDCGELVEPIYLFHKILYTFLFSIYYYKRIIFLLNRKLYTRTITYYG